MIYAVTFPQSRSWSALLWLAWFVALLWPSLKWRWRRRWKNNKNTHLLPSHQVTGTQVRTISPKNISNLPMSRGTGSLWGSRPRDRGSECILLLWRILWMTWYKSMLSSGGKSMHSCVPQSGSISCRRPFREVQEIMRDSEKKEN